MDITTYTERATVIFNPDGSVKGSEAHVLTGYLESRPVPDAPGGATMVFVVVAQEVRPVEAKDFSAVMDEGSSLLADNAAKSSTIEGLLAAQAEFQATTTGLTNRAETAEAELAEQATLLSTLREDNNSMVARLRAAEALIATLTRIAAPDEQEPATVEG